MLGTLREKAEQGGTAAAQLSLFPITAAASLSLLLWVLTAPWDHSHRAVFNPYENGTEELACREGNTDLLSQTALMQSPGTHPHP